MSKYKFKITYRNENKYGQYWGDNRYTVSIIAETIEQAKQKLDEIEKNDYDMHKNILTWEAEEILEEKDKEIKRLKEEYMMLQNASDKVEEKKDREIERLNNIINEIGKYLWEERYNHHGEYVLSGRKAEDIYTLILDKLEELKGVDKE